jgi:hypothetical protein
MAGGVIFITCVLVIFSLKLRRRKRAHDRSSSSERENSSGEKQLRRNSSRISLRRAEPKTITSSRRLEIEDVVYTSIAPDYLSRRLSSLSNLRADEVDLHPPADGEVRDITPRRPRAVPGDI